MISTATIEEACDLVTDGTHYTPKNIGRGIPFLTVKDVTDDALDFIGCSFISDNDFRLANAGNSAPQRGDILFSKDGTVGKVHVVSTDKPFAVLSSLAILRPKPDLVDPKYFGFVLRSPRVLDDALKRKTGSAIRRVILSDLKSVRVPLPPLPEQRQIAAILDRTDALRAKRRAALAQLDTLTQSIFLDTFGSVRDNPNGWQVVALLTRPITN
ncbi:MAG: restriction endonuclease subunit S [Xanthomonadaceae bacterium]|nr:restriction endonuclease subunit S [Xanthomonadaceae bacterium]